MNQPPTTDTQPYLIALLGGAALWLLTSLISGRAEALDARMYWTVTYPLAILLAGVLGYRAPRRAWRWGLAVMLVQAPVMMLTSGGSMSLLPLATNIWTLTRFGPATPLCHSLQLEHRRCCHLGDLRCPTPAQPWSACTPPPGTT